MGFRRTLVLHLCVASFILVCSSGPVPQTQQVSPNKIQDLKSKLEALQKLLQELSKQDTVTASTTTTQEPTSTTTTASQKVENVPLDQVISHAGGTNQDITPETLKNLVSQLTPQDIETLKQVRERLVTLKGLLERQQQQSHVANNIPQHLQSRTYIEPAAAKRTENVNRAPANNFPRYDRRYDDGTFLDSPVADNMLGGGAEQTQRDIRGQRQQKVAGGQFLPVETSNGRFGPILRELHRQNVLHTVKRHLLENMKYAHDNGVSLREVLQTLTQTGGRQASPEEAELNSLS